MLSLLSAFTDYLAGLIAFVAICCGALAASLLASLLTYRMQAQSESLHLSRRLIEGSAAAAELTAPVEKLSVTQKSSSQSFCGFCAKGDVGRRLLRLMEQAGIAHKAESTLRTWIAATMLLAALSLMFVLPLVALVIMVLSTVAGLAYLQSLADKRRQAMRAALPDMLDELAQSLRAGRSLPQSINYVLKAQAEDSVLVFVLRRLDADARLGRSCVTSLKDLARSAELREFSSVAAVFEISARVGGGTPALLEQTATSIRHDLMLNSKLKVQTAQGRSSVRLVASVPFALIALMSLMMPGYLAQWLGTGGGQFLFALAMVLVAVGLYWVRRVVNIYV